MNLHIDFYKKVNRRIREIKVSFNPLFLWVTVLWCASKVLQWVLRSENTVWEISWNWFLDTFDDDAYNLIIYGTGTLSVSLIIVVSALFLFMDLFLWPKSLRKYKVQLNTNEPVDFRKMMKAILLITCNQIFISLPFTYFLFYTWNWRGIPNVRDLENFPTAIFNVLICITTYELCFYFSHRLLHHKWFYKYVHKVHHEWTASIAIIALYSHPVEHLIVNLGSVFAGIIVTGCHIATGWLWLTLLLISTLGDHSGYHIPFIHSSEYHDYHHLKFNVNYGALGILDGVFATDKTFRKTINDIRHKTLLTFKSAREKFPDPLKKD